MSDPVLRRTVELEAMQHARVWLRGEGHRGIRDTSANHPFDYEIGPKRAPTLRVEVKGTTGGPGSVTVTANEVLSAQHGGVPTILLIVHDIRLTFEARSGTWTARGGRLRVVDPWLPDDRSLTPLTYRYEPPLGG